ncbi:hypothetical protein G9A89_003883 [Geosiphon pyriformis]|nr:hypothetical protein G9A89_003883 [Geosiphon pyriformis]
MANFGISDPWEAAESEKEEKESEDQKFTYQHPIIENPEQQLENPEIKTPNIRMPPNQRNQGPELINQQNLPLVIVINQPPFNPIVEPIQQPLQLPSQQPRQQQLLQQPSQPPNLDPMAYAPIAKLDNFTGEEDDTQIWLNDVEKAITANGWNDARAMQYQSLINKPQDFNAFKVEFLRYFSNNNSINCLVNAFTTIKQGETEAVTTYLRRFHRNLCQIQAIDANYFTASQILNQFIHGLRSSILQHICSLHSGMLQDTVTCARDFESTESEANHAQAVNLVMNGSSELDSKLENLHNDTIIKETLIVAKINHTHLHQPINSGNRKCVSATIVRNKDISKLTFQTLNHYPNQNQDQYQNNYLPITQQPIYHPPVYQPPIHQPQPQNPAQMTSGNPRSRVTQNWRLVMVVHQPIPSSLNSPSGSYTQNLDTSRVQNPNSQHYLSLLVTPENAISNNTEFNQHIPTNTILPITIFSDKSLAAIFSFELKENTTIPLFSGAALEEKPITAMYTDARVDGHSIKLILDIDRAASARIITADGATKTPISEIDDFPFEVNGIVTPIKVLELQLTYQGQYIRVPATCGHFKTPSKEKLLIELEEEKEKPTWEAYQVSWADEEHNELLPILSWDDNYQEKGKQKKELTWETDDLTWTNHDESKLTSSWEWEENNKNKGKGKEKETTQTTTAYNTYTIPQ